MRIEGPQANKNIIILLDGAVQRKVFIADDEEGFVERYVLDKDGLLQIDPKNGDRAWSEKVFGKVKILFD